MSTDRTEHLNVRVPPDLKAALVEAARAKDRTLASVLERVLREWLATQKPPPKTRKAQRTVKETDDE